MIQQVANQFSEGINLDTNPIAMSNHQLKSALNATMITMNGNELVLQNDMGNARVESAYLPAGYVPVGMTEFGGIVYVASHNPLTGQSQIGCFPSPERNISSDEINESLNKCFYPFSDKAKANQFEFLKEGELYITSFAQKLGIKVDSPIRPGDKFSIEMSDKNEFSNLLELIDKKAFVLEPCTINSDGAFVVISDLIEPYDYWVKGSNISYEDNGGKHYQSFIYSRNIDGLERRYNIYKNKIVGDLYLKLTLNTPNNIPYYITGDQENGESWYTIHIPKVNHITKYRVFITSNKGEFFIDIDQDGKQGDFEVGTIEGVEYVINYYQGTSSDNQFRTLTYRFTDDKDVHNYTIIPYFQPDQLDVYPENLDYNSGYLVSMACKGSIDLAKLGKGIINFTQFKYYNNTTDGIFTLNYSMETYLKSSQFVTSVDLCTVDYNELLENDSLSTSPKEFTYESGLNVINIGGAKMSYFGNFQTSMSYTDGLEAGKIYVAFLRATINNAVEEKDSYKYSKPFLLFTSSMSNYLFASNLDMYVDAASGNNVHNKEVDEATNQLWDDYIGIPCKINWQWSSEDYTTTEVDTTGYSIKADDARNELYYKATKKGQIKYTLNPTITLQFGNDFPLDTSKVKAEFIEGSIGVDEASYSYSPTLVGTHSTNNFDTMLTTPVEQQDCSKSSEYSVSFDDRVLTCETKLVSQFESGVTKVENEEVVGDAFLPLLDDSVIGDILQQELLEYPTPQNSNTDQQEQSGNMDSEPVHYELNMWFGYCTKEGDGGSHSRKSCYLVDLSTAEDLSYKVNANTDNVTSYFASTDNEQAVTDIYSVKTDNPDISRFTKPFLEELKKRFGEVPLIIFFQPTKDSADEKRGRFRAWTDGQEYLNCGGYNGCIPMLLDRSGIYRPIEDVGKALSFPAHDGLQAMYGYITKLVDRYKNNGLILQENQTYYLSYKHANNNDIVYSQPYNCIYDVKVHGITDISLGSQFPEDAIISMDITSNGVVLQGLTEGSKYDQLNNNLKTLDTYFTTNAVKLPKATLIDANNMIKKYDENEIHISVNAPDIEDAVAQFLANVKGGGSLPAIIEGNLLGTTDAKGKALNPAYMYFLGNDNLLYSSKDLVNEVSEFTHKYKASYLKLAQAIDQEVLTIAKDENYSHLYGLYINFSKAKSLNKVVSNSSGRKDIIGEQNISFGGNYKGIMVSLVGDANAYTTFEQW